MQGKKFTSIFKGLFLSSLLFFVSFNLTFSQASPVTLISSLPSSVRVYEKFEIKFNVNTSAENPYFYYDENPPAGVRPKIGVTVDGIFEHLESGKRYVQPAFYMTEVIRSGTGKDMRFFETNKKYWVLRFSPQQTGTYKVSIRVKDKNQDVTTFVGQFTATSPIKKGFIRVSQQDPRYFEYSNGELYFPIGPAWIDNKSSNPNATYGYSQYVGTGQNFERFWMGGLGIYSTNWSRWISSAERMGNEGYMTNFAFDNGTGEKVPPGGELSYQLFYPDGYRLWLTTWVNPMFGPYLKAGTKYRLEIVYKTANVSGPRVSGYPYGFVVKAYVPDIMWRNHTISEFESFMRSTSAQTLVPYDNQNHDWRTLTLDFTASQNWENIFLYLDNVSNGQVYIYKFSIREILPDGSLGGEVIRNPLADQHTYFDQRPAAFVDWMVEEAEKAGVHILFVVHDKNDWIQNHLTLDGKWTSEWTNGYYYPENTKGRWLLKQWYRYLAARWGYSTAIFGWELNNEGAPYDTNHWRTAEEFARFMHQTDSHPHLVSTSFWCCWAPTFWKDKTNYPNIDYADVHEYTNNPQVVPQNYTYDEVSFIYYLGVNTAKDNVGKPVLIGEHGVAGSNWGAVTELQQPNSGVYYHNMLWAQLNSAQIFAPNYWFSEHLRYINREAISKIFYQFVSNLDVNKGGYTGLNASVSNSKLRVLGQKNISKNFAYGWIQNVDYTWYNAYRNYYTTQSGTISFLMNPNTSYTLEWWDTYTGNKTYQTVSSNSQGYVTISVNNLQKDIAFKLYSTTTPPSYPPLSVSCSASPNPATVNQTVTFTASVSGGTGSYTYSWSGACTGSSSSCSRSFSSAGTYTANLTVTSGSETKSTSCSVTVQAPQPLPTVDLKVNNSDGPISVTLPTTITLTWTSQNASSCTASGSWSGSKSTSGSQSISLSSAGTYTYTLTCTNSSGSSSDSVTVNAQSQPSTTTQTTGEWTQFAHDPQRTSYTNQVVPPPWRWKWSWNGPDANGNPVSGKFRLPRNSQPVTGGGRVYIAAGPRGVFALNEQNGSVVWNVNPGNARIDSTPAYDPEQNALFVLSSNGVLYKLNASNGSVISSFNTGQTILKTGFIYGGDPNQTLPLPPLIYGEKLIFSAGTKVFALNKNTMTQIWVYDSGGSPVVTPPAYSPSYNRVVVVTQDLYVHAIDGSNGTRVWRVKPTNRVYGNPGERNLNFAQAEFGWPVIAERHGLVFVKYRLDWYALYDPSHPWPADNNLIRNLLINNSHYQALFPLRLTDGSLAFITNVSHNGWGDGGYLPMGANIVIKQFPDVTEVAYLNIRGRNNLPPDSPSGDSNFGEMVLDDTTIPGLKAGYLRWMQYGNYGWEPYSNNEVPAADEPPYLTMASNYFLGAHWIAGYAMEIVDRSPSRGSFDNPILTRPLPHIAVVSGSGPCSNYSSYSPSHYVDGNFAACTIDGEWRALRGPGFYIYWNQGKIYDQYWSEFASWVVSNNTVYFLSTDGALVALESGNPAEVLKGEKLVERKDIIETLSNLATKALAQIKEISPGYISLNDPRIHRFIGKKVMTRGIIKNLVINDRGVFIRFEPSLYAPSIVIKRGDYEKMKTYLENKLKLGKKIRVEGRLEYYRGKPSIFVTDISQIRFED